MSTFVNSPVGYNGSDHLTRYGMINEPYLMQDQRAFPQLTPTVVPYNGWASYKNVISGNYNRHLCWNCSTAIGFPQSPGVYDLNIAPPAGYGIPTNYIKDVNRRYADYQKIRMCNNPGNALKGYSNYHNTEQYRLPPKEYVKGWWPDEQQDVTKVPRN